MVAIRYLIALVALAAALPAAAVCLDPKTFISGYHLPLNDEVRSTRLIAIGKITKEMALQEDPNDADGITAHIYTVQISRQLKGHLPKIFKIRIENDSGRYLMDVGEEHLLFLAKEDKYFRVDSCGNSSVLPRGNAMLKQVEAKLARASNAP
jgi:hypothetical protein